MLTRLGLPDVRAHRWFVSAIALDAIGSGVFMPVSALYFVRTTDVGLSRVGLALSLAALVAPPVTLGMGYLVDHLGAKRVLLGANATSAVGYAMFPLAHSFIGVLAVVTSTAVGMAGFWASFGPLVAAISCEGQREKWFGFIGALRNVGFAVGGLVSGFVIAAGTNLAYDLVVWANVASLVASFMLISTIRAGAAVPHDERSVTTWSVVLRDRPHWLLVALTCVYALASQALNIAIPLYGVESLHLPGWVAGAIFTLNTLMVGFGQGAIVARMTGHRRARIIETSSLTFAASFVMMACAAYLPTAPAIVIMLLGAIVYTLGEILGGPVISTIAVDSRPAETRGRYMAFHQMSWQVSGVVAPVTFAWLITQGRPAVWLVLVMLMGAGVALSRTMPTRLPVAGQPVTNASLS